MSLSLYPESQVYQQINALIERGDLSEDEYQIIINQQIHNELTAQGKAEVIAQDLLNLEAFQTGIDSVIADLKTKKERAERHADAIKRGILSYMELKEQKLLEAGVYKFRRMKSSSLKIVDTTKIPGEYKELRQETVIKKNEIKADIKNGKLDPETSGVELIDNYYLKFE